MSRAFFALIFAVSAVIVSSPEARAAGTESFSVRAPADPLILRLSSPAIPTWGRTPRLRLVYYVTDGRSFNDVDRRAILRELRLISDFYGYFGLKVSYDDRVYEVKGLDAERHDYHYIKKQLEERGLLLPWRTIVFATFDVGRGGEMALTGLNDSTVRSLECPRPGKGYAWWCDRPESAHWGGSVQTVGLLLGLSHPSDYTRGHPYVFADGRTYFFDDRDGKRSVMEHHDLFFRNPDNALLPHEVDLLYRKFHDSGAAPPLILPSSHLSPLTVDPQPQSFPLAKNGEARESLTFSSVPIPRFGRTPPLRLIYYILPDDAFVNEDRDAIRRQVRRIQDFYDHFGLEVAVEDRVYEVRASTDAPLSRSFYGVMDLLMERGVYAAGRTVVFTDFDVGRGGKDQMALTSVNSLKVDHRVCPGGKGLAWWCGRPLSDHRGGCVHEVGHLFGLEHPSSAQNPFTVMGDHWKFGNDPRTGLLPSEIDILKRRFVPN